MNKYINKIIFYLHFLRNKLNNNKLLFLLSILSSTLIIILLRLPYIIINNNFNEFLFNILYTIYWIINILFIIVLFIKINKEKFIKHSNKILFIIIFLYLLYWIPYQIDMTDAGKQLSISWFNYNKLDIFNGPHLYKIGGFIINGTWLRIIGQPLLIWGRIGYIIVMSLSALFSYKIVKLYYTDIYVFTGIIITTILITSSRAIQVIDHNNLPILFLLVSVYFFCKYINGLKENKINYLFNILSIFFILLSIFTRTTVIILLVFPLIYFIIYYFYYKKDIKYFLLNIFTFYLPLIIILIIFSLIKITDNISFVRLFYSTYSAINDILLNIFSSTSQNIYILSIIKLNIYHVLYIIIGTSLLTISFFFLKKIIIKYKKCKFYNKILNYFLISTLFLLFLVIIILEKTYFWFIFSLSFIFSFYLIIFNKKIDNKNIFLYLFFGIILVIMSFLGSNVGAKLMITNGGIFIIMPLIIAIIRKNKDMIIKKDKLIYIIPLITFCFLFILGIYKKNFDNNVRDMPKKYLTTMFKTSALFGIYSTKERVEAIDDIINFIRLNISNNDKILFFNSIPIFYYILDREYFFNEPWVIQLKNISVYEEIENMNKKNELKYIVFSKKSPRENNWPLTDIECRESDIDFYKYMINFALKYFKKIYENNAFIVFKINNDINKN